MEIKFSRHVAKPSAWTFTIKPINDLVMRYVDDGKGWIDPFAGEYSPAEFTNDQHPLRNALYHLEAEEFCKLMRLKYKFKGVLLDPPYSYRQISEHYKELGKKASQLDTSSNFYNRVMNAICDSIEPGGYAITCGWNSNGFGKNRGFELIEVMIVAHGSHHNDTIVTVERKL